MITQEQFNKLTEQNNEILTREQEYDVFEFYNANKTIENRNKIALKNYKLIFKPAWEYTRFGSEREDLEQEAFLGLLQAIDKFDYTKGVKFSVYAYTWFNSYLQKCTIDDGIIHIPFNIIWQLEKMKRLSREYEDKYGEGPSDIYLLKIMGIDRSELGLLKQYETRTGVLSMDYSYKSDDGESLTFHNFISDEEQEMDNLIDRLVAENVVNVILKYVPQDRRELIERRYGLNGNLPHTFKELSEIYKISETALKMKLKRAQYTIRRNPKIRAMAKEIADLNIH